jgi:hypothetical protein
MDERMSAERDDDYAEKPEAGETQAYEDHENARRLLAIVAEARVPDKRWRKRAQEGVEFFYDRQWKAEDREKLEARRQPVVTINRIKPTIRLIHGLVVSQPVDVLAKPVGKNDDGIAELATASLKYVNSVNDYKTLRERVYLDGLLYGVGWGMAGLRIRNRDRRSEPVQYRRIDPREIRLDPQSQEWDVSDARFIVWTRRVNLRDLQRAYPRYAAKLAGMVGKRDPNLGGVEAETWEGVPGITPAVSDWKNVTAGGGWNQSGTEADGGPRQVDVHEIWERYPEEVWLYERADGVPQEFAGPEDPEGQAVIYDPEVTAYYEDTITRVKYSILAGECLLHEAPSPYKHDRLPFAPCWCDRDEHGDPVSMVESLKDPQREVNHRRSKALHDLNARPIRVSRETLNATGLDVDEVGKHAQDPNAVWIGEPGGVDYLNRDDRTGAQLDLYRDSKDEIQSTSGANDSMMGYQSSGSVSGKAQEIQISQGQTMMRPTESNLRAFDRQMAEMGLQLIQQAHTEEWTIRLRDEMGRDKWLTLNERSVDPETGMERVTNTLEGMRMEVEIDAMPWTPTLRARNAEMIKDLASSEGDPLLRVALVKLALQVSDMPGKGQILDIFNQAADQAQQMAMGQAGPPMPPPGMPGEPPPIPPEGAMPPDMGLPPEAVA